MPNWTDEQLCFKCLNCIGTEVRPAETKYINKSRDDYFGNGVNYDFGHDNKLAYEEDAWEGNDGCGEENEKEYRWKWHLEIRSLEYPLYDCAAYGIPRLVQFECPYFEYNNYKNLSYLGRSIRDYGIRNDGSWHLERYIMPGDDCATTIIDEKTNTFTLEPKCEYYYITNRAMRDDPGMIFCCAFPRNMYCKHMSRSEIEVRQARHMEYVKEQIAENKKNGYSEDFLVDWY